MRSCVLAVAITVMTACAQPISDYDKAPSPLVEEDSITVIIQNDRARELGIPHFYLEAMGRQSLGTVDALAHKVMRVARKWLPSDGCISATVHYAGSSDYHSAPFCWVPGMKIFISLNQGGELLVAWAHR